MTAPLSPADTIEAGDFIRRSFQPEGAAKQVKRVSIARSGNVEVDYADGTVEDFDPSAYLVVTAPDDGEHTDGDGCAIYDTGYGVHVNGDLAGKTSVEDVEVGDTYNDPAFDPEDEWLEVYDVAVIGDVVHIDSTNPDEETE